MASSNASVHVHAPSRNPSDKNITPLEGVVTGEPSGSCDSVASVSLDSDRLTRHASRQYAEREAAWAAGHENELVAAQVMLDSHRFVLRGLKAWHQWDTNRYASLSNFLMSKSGFPKRPICPTPAQLLSLATYFFPPRRSLRVVVCDFGESRFERFEVDLENVKQYWEDKPIWVTVRWIHVPVGPGLVESSVEELFSQCEVKEGPYNGFEILNFRSRQHLQDQSDVFNILRESPHLSAELDELNFRDDANRYLARDVRWGADLLGAKRGFWKDVQSDLPWQLDEGIRSDFSKVELAKGSLAPKIGKQLLSRHFNYSNAVLVRDYFRCFPREDGFLLTTSPTIGLNYLDLYYERYIEISSNARILHPDYSALENIRRRWNTHGTTSWEMKSVHWLMVLLIIELQVAPHGDHLWKKIPDIQNAYLPIVRDLKRRRASRFRRHESVNLVREYVSCMDEISQIHEISMQKIEFLGRLREHCNALEKAYSDDATASRLGQDDLLTERIDAAIRQIKKDNDNLPRLINDLKASLDVLFQLRTIEQNELAIIAESNNKAILVFTVVTIIFLPLSFFTSYFGMNLQGIANTDKTQGYFWAVCGSITLFVVSFTVVFGFKERLYGWMWANRDYSRARELRH